MIKSVLFMGILLSLIALLSLTACAASSETQTVTVTAPRVTVTVTGPGSTVTSPGASVTVTLPGSVQTVILPPLTGTPPLTPHSLSWSEDENCFFCHPIPRGHEGRSLALAICQECHKEGPSPLF